MMVGRVSMDLFQHRYYKLNKIFMMLIGQWPYQSTRVRCGIVAVLLFFYTGILVPHILGLVKHLDEETILLDWALVLFINIISASKLIALMWNSQKTLKLLNDICTNWQVWARDREVNILHEYAEQGRMMTIAYTVTIFSTGILFMTPPLITKIIDVLLDNGTEPGIFPLIVDYYHLDAQKYYFYLIMHLYVCMSMVLLIITTTDVMFFVYVQHVCGIFAALGHKLERIGKNDKTVEKRKGTHALNTKDMDFTDLVSCIDIHNDAIEYAKLIEAIYTWTCLITLGLGAVTISITGLQVLVRKSNFTATARFMIVLFTEVGYLCVAGYISQIFRDHSMSIHNYICNGQWYQLSLKAQKLLPLMIMRCNIPCQITGGNFIVMSMRTCGLTLKTALSYFALARSVQRL